MPTALHGDERETPVPLFKFLYISPVFHFVDAKLEPIPMENLKNYYKSIAEHKDVQKLQMMLSNAISHTKPEIQNALEIFSGFQFLWEEDRNEAVAVSCLFSQQ